MLCVERGCAAKTRRGGPEGRRMLLLAHPVFTVHASASALLSLSKYFLRVFSSTLR